LILPLFIADVVVVVVVVDVVVVDDDLMSSKVLLIVVPFLATFKKTKKFTCKNICLYE
jgi:hypothetical protein